MAGIADPYELYKYVYPSEAGTSLGSGMGGMKSLSAMFRDRYVDCYRLLASYSTYIQPRREGCANRHPTGDVSI